MLFQKLGLNCERICYFFRLDHGAGKAVEKEPVFAFGLVEIGVNQAND